MRGDEKTTKITLKFPTGVGCNEKVGAEAYRPALIAISFSLPAQATTVYSKIHRVQW